MSTTDNTIRSWKSTPLGRVAKFIGSVRLAVPALALAAGAMVWGTWIESTQDRIAAADIVYGSWWFMLLMALICASLVLSVAVRYPWKPKHTGFIVVHASMISLITIGFYTMYSKIEARVILAEGETSSIAVLEDRWVQLLEPSIGGARTLDRFFLAGDKPIQFDLESLSDVRIEILEQWDNSAEVTKITDDGTNPFHAIEIAAGPGAREAESGDWLGQLIATDPAIPSNAAAFAVRVIATGETWTPPTEGPYAVITDSTGTEYALGAAGEPIGQTGWTLTEIAQFQRATIGESGLIDRPDGPANPATLVVLTHADGSVEQQIGFEKFRGEPFVQQQSGETPSGLVLTYLGPSFTDPTLAIMRDDDGTMHAILADPDGSVETFAHDGAWPWHLTAMGTPVSVLRSYPNARASKVLAEADAQDSNSPVLTISTDSGPEQLVWNTPTPVTVGGQELVLQYGSVQVQLPFALELVDFRKLDYPGVDMAMAFESDVIVTDLTGPRSANAALLATEGPTLADPFEFKIFMNHPYEQDGWKVYQASFIGDSITVFQVTYDPGLVPMYIACTTLCIGILLIFYSRKLSFGHPGIPAPFGEPGTTKE